MSERLILVLYPFWIGIILNIIFTIINVSLIGHYGKIASGYMKYSPWFLGTAWVMLIGLAVFNYF
jgi:hypothetical protein